METSRYQQGACVVLEHRLPVPLDHRETAGPRIELFAREIIRPGGANLPHLLFLQGGPGGAGPRLSDWQSGWVGAALEHYRVVLLDQRGTGQSTPLSAATLRGTDQEIADHLTLFLQRQIVGDAEMLRESVGAEQWTTLGQSYGGFLTLTYLSYYPGSVRASIITGGLPGLVPIDHIYQGTYAKTALRNQTFFARHPEDEKVIRQVAAHLHDTAEWLPTGERLTPTRLRSLGQNLGGQTSFDAFHYLWEGPFITSGGTRRLSPQFLAAVAAELSLAERPLYAALQEAIYGPTTPGGTRWSAERLAEQLPGFRLGADPLDVSEPWYLAGEHMYREALAEDPSLAPLVGAIDRLAARTAWEAAYDTEALAANRVPVAAAIYSDDMFVPRDLSLQTAHTIGARTWVTHDYQHDGLRAAGDSVFRRLHAMLPT